MVITYSSIGEIVGCFVRTRGTTEAHPDVLINKSPPALVKTSCRRHRIVPNGIGWKAVDTIG